jgi:hypothetical protein
LQQSQRIALRGLHVRSGFAPSLTQSLVGNKVPPLEPGGALPLVRSDLFQIADARWPYGCGMEPAVRQLGCKIDPPQCQERGCAHCGTAAHPATVRRHQTRQNRREDLMTVSEQALLLTGELFVLSFVAIWVFWFADKLRRSFTGKP